MEATQPKIGSLLKRRKQGRGRAAPGSPWLILIFRRTPTRQKDAERLSMLLESYFRPAHRSSAEKMKLELEKVRDEFKMSESVGWSVFNAFRSRS